MLLNCGEGFVTSASSRSAARSSPRSALGIVRPLGRPRQSDPTARPTSTLVATLRSHRAAQSAEKLALGAAYHDEGLVFARPDGSTLTPWNFGAAFRDLVRRAGVSRIRLHDLRDTHASLLAKAGVPIEVVSKRLGHSTIAITVDRYLVVYRDRDEAAASAFDKLVA